MNNNVYCVIMAGGIGARFWPISRTARPKQFLDILGTGRTFIQSTYDRFSAFIRPENFLVVTNAAYRDLVLEQLPELHPEQVLSEPIGRNTAPAASYAAFRIASKNRDSVMIVTPSDHLVTDPWRFGEAIEDSVRFAEKNDALVTIGLKPTWASTAYGYIQVEKPFVNNHINSVKTFTEKPERDIAEAFVASGDFFWNSGVFVWRTALFLKVLERYLPETYSLLNSIREYYGTDEEQRHIDDIYSECRGISIDYGILEQSDNVYVRTAEFGWSDLGSWGALYEYLPKDRDNNTLEAGSVMFEAKGNLVHLPEGKVAVIEGLTEYIVVDTDDILLVCPRSSEGNIRKYRTEVKIAEQQV